MFVFVSLGYNTVLISPWIAQLRTERLASVSLLSKLVLPGAQSTTCKYLSTKKLFHVLNRNEVEAKKR